MKSEGKYTPPPPSGLTVPQAAVLLNISQRTIRYRLRRGLMLGTQRADGRWQVWLTENPPSANPESTITDWRPHLRMLGVDLLSKANMHTTAHRKPGGIYLDFLTPRGMKIVFMQGRLMARGESEKRWAPVVIGVTLPRFSAEFWRKEHIRWKPIVRLLYRYDVLRHWTMPAVQSLPGMAALLSRRLDDLAHALQKL